MQLFDEVQSFLDTRQPHYEELKQTLQPDSEEKEQASVQQTELSMIAFQHIMQECDEELQDADEERMVEVLNLLFDLDFSTCIKDQFCTKIWDFADDYLAAEHMRTNESKLQEYKKDLDQIEVFQERLLAHFKNLNNRFCVYKWLNRKERLRCASLLRQLDLFKNRLETFIKKENDWLSEFIIMNFYNIYIFFTFVIKLLRGQKAEHKLIGSCNQLDRFIKILDDSAKKISLKTDLIYHHAVFELKELRKYALKGFFIEEEAV